MESFLVLVWKESQLTFNCSYIFFLSFIKVQLPNFATCIHGGGDEWFGKGG
jgi:hypothetical protein